MTPDADRLLALLEAEDGLYERLCQLLRDERAAFARRDARELERIALGKEELADEGRLLEEARLALVARLAVALGLSESRVRVDALCARLGADAQPITGAANRLAARLAVARELLHASRALARDSLAQVQATLRALEGASAGSPRYGLAPPQPATGRLVRQSA